MSAPAAVEGKRPRPVDPGGVVSPDAGGSLAAEIAPEDLYRHFKVLHKPTGRTFQVLGGDGRYEVTGPGFRDYRATPDGRGVLLRSAVETHPWGWVAELTDLAPAPDGRGTYHPDHLSSMALQLARSYGCSWREVGDLARERRRVVADVTCPECLATYAPGGDDPARLAAAANARHAATLAPFVSGWSTVPAPLQS